MEDKYYNEWCSKEIKRKLEAHFDGIIKLEKTFTKIIEALYILIFDDVLDKGDTFRNLKDNVLKTHKNKRVLGLFLASYRSRIDW